MTKTNGYERFENENQNGGGFMVGLLTGAVLGAGLGLLLAPKSGADLRRQLSGEAEDLARHATDGYRTVADTAGEWAEKGREVVGKAKDAVARGTDEAERYVRDAADTASSTIRRG